MSYRHLDNIDEKIINATIQIGSSNEANKLSTKEIAKACEISEFVIYDHFKSKDNLISITNHKIFEDSAAYVEQLILVEHQPFEVYWNKMVDFFLQNQNYVGWSINYGHIFPRPEKPADSDEFREDITAEARKCFSYLNLKNDWEYYFFYMWMFRSFVFFAQFVLNGELQDTPETRSVSCHFYLVGIQNFEKTN
jgi:hypothetical protein